MYSMSFIHCSCASVIAKIKYLQPCTCSLLVQSGTSRAFGQGCCCLCAALRAAQRQQKKKRPRGPAALRPLARCRRTIAPARLSMLPSISFSRFCSKVPTPRTMSPFQFRWVPAQVSTSSLDRGSKITRPPIALVRR